MPLFGIGPLITFLLSRITLFFLNTKLSGLAFKLAFYGIIIALFAAFALISLGVMNGLRVAMPPQFAFAFGFIPNSVPIMFGAYVAAVIAERILSWKATFILHATGR